MCACVCDREKERERVDVCTSGLKASTVVSTCKMCMRIIIWSAPFMTG